MGETTGCKADIVSDKYDLGSLEYKYQTLDEHLYARWTGDHGQEAEGFRTLAGWFNKRILKSVYKDEGLNSTETSLDSDYEGLTGDDDLRKEDLKDRLRAEGINADRLVRDFVSWGTIRNHLLECLDGEKQEKAAETDWESKSIQIASELIADKASTALKSLSTKGRLPRGDEAGVDIQVQLTCPDCPTRIQIEEAIDRGYICKTHRDD